MSIKSIALATAAVLTLSAAPAFAQTSGTSTATNDLNVNTYAVQGGSGAESIHYSGTTQAYTTPMVYAPSIGGANPCLIGVGGGAAGGPVGFSLTLGKSDEGCTRRADAGAWWAMGEHEAAIARMCQDADNKKALEAAGKVCPQDRPKVVAVAAPVPVVVAAAAPPAGPVRSRPQWCASLSPAERVSYKMTCG